MVPTDSSGKEIKEGMTLIGKRYKQLTYKVIRGDFDKSLFGEGPDLIADGGHIKAILTRQDRSDEFTIVEDAHDGTDA